MDRAFALVSNKLMERDGSRPARGIPGGPAVKEREEQDGVYGYLQPGPGLRGAGGEADGGGANRAGQAEIQPGGKGINVSCVLHELGVETTALGFVAGFTGCELERELARRGVRTEFIHLAEGQTRINVKLKGQEETEINAAGPVILPEAQRRLREQLDALQAGDVLVISGSVPASMPGGSYETLLRRGGRQGVLTVVDAAGGLLRGVLPCRPFLIKPNHLELGELFGKS